MGNTLDNLAKMALMPLLVGGLGIKGYYNDHVVFIDNLKLEGYNQMVIHAKNGTGGLIVRDKDFDGRFDEFYLRAPKGSELEKYVSLDSLTKIYNHVLRTGEKQ